MMQYIILAVAFLTRRPKRKKEEIFDFENGLAQLIKVEKRISEIELSSPSWTDWERLELVAQQ